MTTAPHRTAPHASHVTLEKAIPRTINIIIYPQRVRVYFMCERRSKPALHPIKTHVYANNQVESSDREPKYVYGRGRTGRRRRRRLTPYHYNVAHMCADLLDVCNSIDTMWLTGVRACVHILRTSFYTRCGTHQHTHTRTRTRTLPEH